MSEMASQITSVSIVYLAVYSDADQRKYQSSASLAFVRGIHRGPVNSPHKWPVTRKMFTFDDVIMTISHPRPFRGSRILFCLYRQRNGFSKNCCVFNRFKSEHKHRLQCLCHKNINECHLTEPIVIYDQKLCWKFSEANPTLVPRLLRSEGLIQYISRDSFLPWDLAKFKIGRAQDHCSIPNLAASRPHEILPLESYIYQTELNMASYCLRIFISGWCYISA